MNNQISPVVQATLYAKPYISEPKPEQEKELTVKDGNANQSLDGSNVKEECSSIEIIRFELPKGLSRIKKFSYVVHDECKDLRIKIVSKMFGPCFLDNDGR